MPLFTPSLSLIRSSWPSVMGMMSSMLSLVHVFLLWLLSNITHGLYTNFHFGEHHPYSSNFHNFFLIEAKVLESSSRKSYFCSLSLSSIFSQSVYSAYIGNDPLYSRIFNLESFEFSTLGVRHSFHSGTNFIYSAYLPSKANDYPKYFDYQKLHRREKFSFLLIWKI